MSVNSKPIIFLHEILSSHFLNRLHAWTSRTTFWPPPTLGVLVPERNVSYNLPGVDVNLHAKFELCRSNSVAAYREHTHTQSPLLFGFLEWARLLFCPSQRWNKPLTAPLCRKAKFSIFLHRHLTILNRQILSFSNYGSTSTLTQNLKRNLFSKFCQLSRIMSSW